MKKIYKKKLKAMKKYYQKQVYYMIILNRIKSFSISSIQIKDKYK